MNNVKKIISSLLVAVIILTAAPLSGFVGLKLNFDWFDFSTKSSAEEKELAPTGQCGENVYWTFDKDTGLLTISGSGSMYDTKSSFKRNYLIKTVVIENGVTSIGDSAFPNCTGLTSITIPDSVTSIGNYAIFGCKGLTSIKIPNSVTFIGESAFAYCRGLTSITISDNITSINICTFEGCTGLKELTMPCSAEVGAYSFDQCVNIKKITLTKGTGKMYDYDYVYTPWYISKDNIREITLEDGIASICNGAFDSCTGLKSIKIPDSVTSIGSSAFYGCTGLTSITIPDGITSISNSTFSGCTGLTSITIPDIVTSIGSSAFSGCTGLTNITIPDIVTSIGSSAFSGCTGLTSLTIPDKVTNIGSSAFFGCTGLTGITIPDSVTNIGDSTFYGCTGLTGITIPDSVTSIDNYAFSSCSGLTNVKIPDSVTSIGSSAFSGCMGLTSITIPDSVTSIGSSAFQGCTGLTSITIPDSVTSISSRAFYDCKTIYYNAKNAITDSSAFYSAEKIIVGDTVQTIPNDFARGCDNIKSIIIASSVVKIGNDAFNHCDNLESVTFMGDNRIEMGSNIFEYCNKLKIHCKDNSFIAAYAEMNNLTYSIIDDDGNPEYDIKNGMILSYNGNDKKLFVSSGTKIGFGAFENNSVITDVELSSIVTKIYNKAFANCTNLSKIIIPQSVASIGDNAFEGCDKLTIWCYAGSYAEAYAINHDIPVKYINLQLNENTIKLNTNESVNLCASFNTELSDEIELIWTSDNPSVVTVTSDGRITAVGKGKATITATSSTGLYATCVVNVDTVEQEKPRVNSVKIDDISLNYKKSTTLKPTIKADDGVKYTVKYSSSNTKVATVDKNGKVTATKRGSGSATITCTVTDEFGNIVTDTCKVNVKLSFGQILITYVLFGWIWY